MAAATPHNSESTADPRGTITIERIHKSFGDLEVLHDVSLRCEAGKTTCVIGPSGSGKSTLLRCVNQLEVPDRGHVSLDGEIIGFERRSHNLVAARSKRTERQRMQIGMVFQRFNLFPHLTAMENVMLGPRKLLKLGAEQARQEAIDHLERVGMLARKDAYARQLSGGQQQRVAIARALAMRPRAILFDEPTSALDPELVGEVLSVMRDVAAQGLTMLVVTHELTFARNVASQVVFMDGGRVVETGSPDAVLLSPREQRTAAFVSNVFGNRDGYAA